MAGNFLVKSLLLTALSLLCGSTFGLHCSEFQGCNLCLSSPLGCKWCSDLDFVGPRCVESNDSIRTCQSGFEDPQNTVLNTENEDFSDSIQVQPQALALTLRPGQPQSFNISIKPAPNFPLDVYFLMDLSQSMSDDLTQMKTLAHRTAGAVRSISANFRVGFGSFVDKKQAPMDFSNVYQRRNPCAAYGRTCPPNYSFKNHFSLDSSFSNFFRAIRDAKASGNFDDPEGGTDALLQSVVCTQEIGWRPSPARHLLVYITDHQMHFGYDGKIAGVVTPHDGKCHMQMSRSGIYEYTEAERLDYPSISMLAAKFQEFNIYPVFGVAVADGNGLINGNPVYETYEHLTQSIPNSVVEALTEDSSNLVEALKSAYLKIATNIKLQLAQGDLEDLDVKFEALCNQSTFADTPVCTGVLVGDEVSFKVTVTAKKCSPQLLSGKTKLSISTGFFGTVTIDITAICDCQCASTAVSASRECSGLGTLQCGKCHCDPGIYGHSCQCGAAVNGTIPQCRTGTNGLLCSGPEAGECYCGECMCNRDVKGIPGHHFYGDACECSNFECGRGTNSKICSGYGECGCGGVCECDSAPSGKPYLGELCECYPDDDTCRRIPDETPCSGHGKCSCGSCQCQPGYVGRFCELCVSNRICGGQTCRSFDDCITCLFTFAGETLKQEPYNGCRTICHNMSILSVSNAAGATSLNATLQCSSSIASETCRGLDYFVRTTDNVIYVSNSPKNCIRVIPPWLIVVPIVASLIILAIFIIIFIKLFIVYLDYREYRNWMKDLEKVKFSEIENPMFLSAWETFYCPMYPGNFEKGLIGSISTIQTYEHGSNSASTDSLNKSRTNSPRPQPAKRQRTKAIQGPVLRIKMNSSLSQAHSEPTLREESETRDFNDSSVVQRPRAVGRLRNQKKVLRPMSHDLLGTDDDETLNNLISDLSCGHYNQQQQQSMPSAEAV